jgi:hypothetical protein
MVINGGDTDIARVLPSTDEEWHAHLATQGLRLFHEVPPMDVMERALFGLSLDEIMCLSEFTELSRTCSGPHQCYVITRCKLENG